MRQTKPKGPKSQPDPVDPWIDEFIARHGMRFSVARAAFGEPGVPAYEVLRDGWKKMFAGIGATAAETNRASERMMCADHKYFDAHLAEIIRLIREHRQQTQPQDGGSIFGRDFKDLAEESRGCRWCNGQGVAVVYHPRYAGNRVVRELDPLSGIPFGRPGTLPAACVCSAGRWILAKQQADPSKYGFLDLKSFIENERRMEYRIEDPRIQGVADEPVESATEWLKENKIGEIKYKSSNVC